MHILARFKFILSNTTHKKQHQCKAILCGKTRINVLLQYLNNNMEEIKCHNPDALKHARYPESSSAALDGTAVTW